MMSFFMAIPFDGIATNGRLHSLKRVFRLFLGGITIMIRGIKFVSVPVKNQDAALKFYTDALGFRVMTDQEFIPGGQRWIELSIPGADTGLSLFTPEGHEDRIGTFQSISFWCDDVFQTAEVLRQCGVKFFQDPRKESWGTSAIFEDLEGNKFVLSSR
jgi:catechol 2,3-dioxygenase-like lactoylglutathione lyase family enzyme